MPSTNERIWTKGAETFMGVRHTSQERVLHPMTAEIINRSDGSRLLDYGCGDGRLLRYLRPGFEIDVYDSSPTMLELAQKVAGGLIDRMYHERTQIEDTAYDVVVLSMVLICIEDEAELQRVVTDCHRALRPGGTMVVSVTHPCFRPYEFSNFTTSYAGDQPFRYLEDGTPFRVTIEDPEPPSVSFIDTHWSLSHTLNALTEAGLRLVHTLETPDDASEPGHNPFVSPYLILTLTR